MKRPDRQDIINELWYRGNLLYKLHSGQRIIHESYSKIDKQLFVANCSRQWGKSFWAAVVSVMMALSKHNAQIRYGAAFQSDLLDYIIPTFDNILSDCPDPIKGKYNSKYSSYIFQNGSKIRLVGVDKSPNSMRGNTLDLTVLDEASFMSSLDYLYKSVLVPATTHRPHAKIIMISSASSTPAHAFQDYAHKAEAEGGYALFTIYDNPMVDQKTIQRLMSEAGGEESTTWQREYLCKFITDSDLQIIPEWKDEYIAEIQHDQYYFYYHKYVSMDMGVIDFTALLFGYYDFKNATIVIEDEEHLHGPSLITPMIAESVKKKELKLWGEQPVFRRIADNNNPQLLNDLGSMHNLHFGATNKESLEAMINELRIMVKTGRVKVHPRCKQLIGCLKYGVWDKKRKIFARSKSYGHFDHLAALIYLVRNLSTSTNPIPANFGFTETPHKSFIKPTINESSNHKKLSDMLIPKRPNIGGQNPRIYSNR